MTKREYENSLIERYDTLEHKLKIGDRVIYTWWDRRVVSGRIVGFGRKRVKLVTDNWQKYYEYHVDYEPHEYRYPDRIIKIEEDGIPQC